MRVFVFPLRLSIRMRLFAGFGLVLALLAGLVTVGIVSLSRLSGSLDEVAQTQGETQRMLIVDRDIMAMRGDASSYLDQGHPEALGTYREAEAALGEKLDRALAEESVEADRAEIRELQSAFLVWKAEYAKAVDLWPVRDEIVHTKMDALAAEIVERLRDLIGGAVQTQRFETAIIAGNAQADILSGRIAAMRFLAYNDIGAAQKADRLLVTSVETLGRLVDSATEPAFRTSAAELRRLVDEYRGSFGDVQRSVATMKALESGPVQKAGDGLAALAKTLCDQHVELLTRMMADEKSSMARSSALMLSIAGAALVLGLVLAYLVGRSISGRLRLMTGTMTALAGGDRTVDVPATGDQDEIGAMARAVEVFKRQANEVSRLQAEQVAAREQAEAERRRATAGLADRFEAGVGTVVDEVRTSARDMEQTAQAMAAAARQANSRSADGLAAADQASANVQTVAAAAQQLSASVDEISRQVAEAASISRQASGEAERTNERVREFAEAAARIDEVIGLINEIAGRTNLLALNATIEAARAGEAGKGFAVVASEVKNLAKQTADATEEIRRQIAGVQTASGEMVTAIGGISATIVRVTEIASTIAAAVEEQGAATAEIARNAQEAAAGTREVTESISGVTRSAEESGAAAGRVLETAAALGRNSGDLRAEVDRFVGNIRAA